MTEPDDAYHYYAADQHHGLARNPLKAIIAPRPIAWVSTLSPEGVGNLAPYSFFNQVSDSPPMLMFSSVGYKDTVRNIATSGEFSLSLVSRSLAEPMNLTSRDYPADVDEFDAAGLPRMACRAIRAPAVAGSPAVLECRAVEVRQLSALDGTAIDVWMVIGQVVGVHVARACLVDGLFRTELAHPVQRAGYADEYWESGPEGLFRMRR